MGEDRSSGTDDQPADALARRVYHSLNVAVVLYDAEADAVFDCNEAACELFGSRAEQLRGCSMRDLGSDALPAVQTNIGQHIQEAARDESQELEWVVEDSDGTRIPVAVGLTALPSDGEDHVLVELSDLRDRLFRRPQTQIDLLDRMTDAFFALDTDREFTYLNERGREVICEAMGEDLTLEELQGRKIWEAIPEILDTVFYEQYERAFETGETVTFEEYYDPLDTWFEVSAYPSETGLSVFFRDITERRRAKEELEATVEVLHDLYMLGSDSDLSFERRLDRIIELGCRRLDLPYGFLTRISEDTQTIVTSRGDHELLQSGEQCPLEESYCRRTIQCDGLLAVSDAPTEGWEEDPAYDVFGLGCYVGGKAIVDDDLYGTLCFASDDPRTREFTNSELTFVELASRWVSYEIEQREYREELEGQNERLDEFASVVSHDLRNPLNAASAQLNLVRQECDSEHVDAVERAHDRIEAIITDLLTLARQGDTALDMTTVSLPAILDRCRETVGTDGLTLSVETDREIRADEHRVQRLFENLVRNAVEHGSTSSRTESDNAVEHAGPDVTVTVGDLSDGFYIEDDGPGIPADERDQVFEAGYSTSTEGTGFGLHIVENIADAHDWTVEVTEGTDGGARFEITGVDIADPWQT